MDEEKPKYPDFARRFKKAIDLIGLLDTKHTDVGKELGVSGPMIHNYKTGKKLPSMDQAVTICLKTGVCVEWLMAGRGPMTTDNYTIDDFWDEMSNEERADFLLRAVSKKD